MSTQRIRERESDSRGSVNHGGMGNDARGNDATLPPPQPASSNWISRDTLRGEGIGCVMTGVWGGKGNNNS